MLALCEDLLILLKAFKRRQLLSIGLLEFLFHQLDLFLGAKSGILLVSQRCLDVPIVFVYRKHLLLEFFIFLYEALHFVLTSSLLLTEHLKVRLVFKQQLFEAHLQAVTLHSDGLDLGLELLLYADELGFLGVN